MYVTMLPRLEAEEEQRLYRATVAAGGLVMEERGRMMYLKSLERQATGEKRMKKPTAASLQAMGIRVVDESDESEKGGDDARASRRGGTRPRRGSRAAR